ncbi:MAG: SDR family oxidoreductase [Deltaproteobacteria bacterium]|nr:SDR family oxidoreductase [Deltaproteobacteria bacterium]
MGRRLEGYRALVTGASSGIGASLARQLAARGCNLVLTARREDRLRQLADELGPKHGVDVRVVQGDLSQPGAATALFERTEGEGLAIDLLVNNAGLGAWRTFVAAPWEMHETEIRVNLVALTHLTSLFLPGMVERRRGHVMNVASIGAYTPCPNFAVYAATKAYVRNFTEALDHELRGSGVRAISICPGGTKTEFFMVSGQRIKASGDKMMMSAERCAAIAVRKMLAGRRNVVTGWLNALGMWLLRIVPRAWMPWVAERTLAMTVERPAANALHG